MQVTLFLLLCQLLKASFCDAFIQEKDMNLLLKKKYVSKRTSGIPNMENSGRWGIGDPRLGMYPVLCHPQDWGPPAAISAKLAAPT